MKMDDHENLSRNHWGMALGKFRLPFNFHDWKFQRENVGNVGGLPLEGFVPQPFLHIAF